MSDPGQEQGKGPVDPSTPQPHPSVTHALGNIRDQLGHLERMVGADMASAGRVVGADMASAGRHLEPAWLKAHEGENRLPVAGVVAAAIGLQLALPAKYSFHPTWLLPSLTGVLAVGLSVANPTRITRTSRVIRAASIALVAVASLANGWSAFLLARAILNQHAGSSPVALLANGGAIYLTNIIVFALWYWEWDRGGPVARAQALRPYPDFLFPQMTSPELAPKDWRPSFFDYLYVSFTNATAFSPTDTMPLAVWAKMLMAAQSAVALVTVALVVSHAVDTLQ